VHNQSCKHNAVTLKLTFSGSRAMNSSRMICHHAYYTMSGEAVYSITGHILQRGAYASSRISCNQCDLCTPLIPWPHQGGMFPLSSGHDRREMRFPLRL